MRRGGIANKDPSSPSYRFTELQRGPPTQDVSPRLSVEPRGNEKRKHRGKKKKKKTSTKPGAKDGGRNFVQLPPLFPVPHVAPRAQQHRPCPARSHPAPGDAGTARGGAEQSGPWCPRSALCRGCPQRPQGAAGIPTRGASPTLSPTLRWQLSGRRSHSPGKQTHSITYFLPIDNSVNPSRSVFCSDSVTHLICWQ